MTLISFTVIIIFIGKLEIQCLIHVCEPTVAKHVMHHLFGHIICIMRSGKLILELLITNSNPSIHSLRGSVSWNTRQQLSYVLKRHSDHIRSKVTFVHCLRSKNHYITDIFCNSMECLLQKCKTPLQPSFPAWEICAKKNMFVCVGSCVFRERR